MKKLSLLLLLSVAACADNNTIIRVTDQELRHRIFTDCLDRAAKFTPHNVADRGSWSEVVEQCETAASYQSVRKASGPNRHLV